MRRCLESNERKGGERVAGEPPTSRAGGCERRVPIAGAKRIRGRAELGRRASRILDASRFPWNARAVVLAEKVVAQK